MAAAECTEKDERLVKESWEIMKLDVPSHSFRLFTNIMTIAPEAKNFFSFARDSDKIEENLPKIKAHAIKIFTMTCESTTQLRERGVVFNDTTVKRLGTAHFNYGVLDYHFEAVKEALLRTVEVTVEDKWSIDMKNAWTIAYDHLAFAIKAQMKEAAAT